MLAADVAAALFAKKGEILKGSIAKLYMQQYGNSNEVE
jgi:hypothetical protein